MSKHEIALGQLVNVFLQSDVDLNTIYLDESQVQKIQDNLTEEQQAAIANNLSSKTVELNDAELSEINGGSWSSAKKWFKRGLNVVSVGAGLVSGGLLLASKLTDGIDIEVKFGEHTIIDKDNKWTSYAQEKHDVKIESNVISNE